jgi:hypothetical protein
VVEVHVYGLLTLAALYLQKGKMMRTQSDATKLRQAKTRLRNFEFSIRAVRAELIERKKWGQMMSNLCFNLSQMDAYDPAHRQSMKDCHENWDKIPRATLP